jgi:hypothetical protein
MSIWRLGNRNSSCHLTTLSVNVKLQTCYNTEDIQELLDLFFLFDRLNTGVTPIKLIQFILEAE